MPDQETGRKWLTPVLVTLFGAVGGLTAWVWSFTVGPPSEFEPTAALATNIFLGMVAGFAGIYVIKLDSTRVILHSLALALLCGFAWKPTLEAGRELAVTRIQESQVEAQVELAQRSISELQDAEPEEAAVWIEELESISQELMKSSDAVRSPALRAEIDRVVLKSVEAIGEAAASVPEVGARALGSVGAAAMQDNRPAVSRAAADSLVRLAEEENFSVGPSSEVSNSLLRLSAAARATQKEDTASALREQSREVFLQAERRIRPTDEDRRMELRERSLLTRELPPPER